MSKILKSRNLLPIHENFPNSDSDGDEKNAFSKKISLSIKTKQMCLKKQECLVFDIGGKKHKVSLASLDDESKLKSIKDYLNLLHLVQKWETENQHIYPQPIEQITDQNSK